MDILCKLFVCDTGTDKVITGIIVVKSSVSLVLKKLFKNVGGSKYGRDPFICWPQMDILVDHDDAP